MRQTTKSIKIEMSILNKKLSTLKGYDKEAAEYLIRGHKNNLKEREKCQTTLLKEQTSDCLGLKIKK